MINEYSKYIDHTLLAQDASEDDIKKLCDEAVLYKFKSVCVNPCKVKLAKSLLKDSDVLVCSVIGFPLGQNTTTSKVFETFDVIKNGADEIDMVINISKLKADDKIFNLLEINEIKRTCDGRVLKVIVETCLLNEEEKIRACNLIKESNADFIKTSTGFSKCGACIDDIVLFKSILGDSKLIKAAGGIKTFEDLKNMIESGADRIGTSKGIELLKASHDDVACDVVNGAVCDVDEVDGVACGADCDADEVDGVNVNIESDVDVVDEDNEDDVVNVNIEDDVDVVDEDNEDDVDVVDDDNESDFDDDTDELEDTSY